MAGATSFGITLVGLALLLYVPGWLLARLLLPGGTHDGLARLYARVLLGTLLNGWLALLLATVGLFAPWLHLAGLAWVCAAVWLGARLADHRPEPLRLRWRPAETLAFALVGLLALLLVLPPFQTILGARDAGVYANTGLAIARTGGLVQHDPLLAELGQRAQAADEALRGPAEQALSNFLGVQNPERFIATRLHTAGFFINDGELAQGRIVPQHLHLTSAWIGLLAGLFGAQAGLFAPGLLGVLGAWSVGMLGRRLAGPWVGGLAFLLLALNSVQVWFARYSTAETTAQMLTFAALYCFARSVPGSANADTPPRARVVYAGLAGLAAGQLALARIDFFLLVGPLLAYLLYCWLTRRWRAPQTALAAGLGAMLLHAALHIGFIARAYFFDTAFARLQDYALTSWAAQPFITPLLREVYHTTSRSPFKDPTQLWRELAVLALLLAALLLLWRWQRPLRGLESGLRWARPWLLGGLAGGVLLLAGYAYLLRPQVLTPQVMAQAPACMLPANWQTTPPDVAAAMPLTPTLALSPTADLSPTAALAVPAPLDPCLTLQGYVGAPIALPPPPEGVDAKRMIPLANFVRLGWYLSPLGVLLGVTGFALWWWRGLNRASWLFLLVGLVGTLFFVRDTYGTSDQSYIYILRRFVPVAYPTFSLGMAFALVALAQVGQHPSAGWPRWRGLLLRRGAQATSAGLALLLVAFFAWTGRPVFAHVEYNGALPTLTEVAAELEPEAIVLFRGGGPSYATSRDVPDLAVTPLRFGLGMHAFSVKSSNPGAYADALAAQVRTWRAAGHPVYLALSASGGNLMLPGFTLQPAGGFALRVPEYEQLTNQKPRNIAELALVFAFYRLEPTDGAAFGTLPAPLEADDFAAQLRGLYLPEPARDDNPPYAWTNGDALLRLRWPAAPAAPAALTLHAAGGQRPEHLGPAQVCLSVQPETQPWHMLQDIAGGFVPLGCATLTETPAAYTFPLAAHALPAAPTGSMLLRLQSAPWVPAEESPLLHDPRPLGVQMIRLDME